MFTDTSGQSTRGGGDERSAGLGGTGGGSRQAGGGLLIILLIVLLVFVMSSSSAMVFKKSPTTTTSSPTPTSQPGEPQQQQKQQQQQPHQQPQQQQYQEQQQSQQQKQEQKQQNQQQQKQQNQEQQKQQPSSAKTDQRSQPKQEPSPPTRLPAAPQKSRPNKNDHELVTSVFTSATTAIKDYLRRGLKVIDSIPLEGRTIEERTFQVAYASVLEQDYRVELDSLLATLLEKDQWTLLSYLVTVLSSRHDQLLAFCDAWKRQSSKHRYSVHRYLMIDLLFVSIMMTNPLVESGLDTRNILVRCHRYRSDDGDGGDGGGGPGDDGRSSKQLTGEQALTTMRNMMTDYRNLLLLEAQNTLGHRRAEIGPNRYCRYWQLQALHYRHSHSFLDAFVGHMNHFDKVALELALDTMNTKRQRDFEQYQLISVQTLMSLLAKTPQHFYDSTPNVYEFVDRLRSFLHETVLQPDSDLTFKLPFVVSVVETVLTDDLSPVYSVDLSVPKHCPNTNVIHRAPHVNQATKCLVTYDRRFRRGYSINRPYAPLPTDSDPFDYISGSLYLGVGHGSIVDRFQNLDHFSLVEKTAKNRIRYWICSYVNERVAFEGYKEAAATVPKLRLKGVSVLSSRSGRLVNHLLLQTIDTELSEALNDHQGWQASLIDRYLYDEEPLSFADYFNRLQNKQLDTKRLALARKLLEFGIHLYATVMNQLKTNAMIMLSRERKNRVRQRKIQLKKIAKEEADDYQDDDEDAAKGGEDVNTKGWSLDYELLDFNGKLLPTDTNFDHNSTKYEGWLVGRGNVVEETPGRLEQWMWNVIGVKSSNNNTIDEDEKKRFTPESSFARFALPLADLGPVLRTRLVAIMLLTFNALVIQDKPKLFAGHLNRYMAKQTEAAMSQSLTSWLLPNRAFGERQSGFIDQQLISGNTCQLPMCLVLNQRSFEPLIVKSGGANDVRRLAIVTLQVEIAGKTIVRQVLAPIQVPPSELASSNSLADLEHDFETQYYTGMFDCLTHPRIREELAAGAAVETAADGAANLVTIYVWMQHPSDQGGPSQFINTNTIRLQNDEVGEFKIFNVLWRNVQYLIVRQGNRIQCSSGGGGDDDGGTAKRSNITGVSKLWYGSFNVDYEAAAAATPSGIAQQDECNEAPDDDSTTIDYKARKTIQLNDEGYFYVEAASEERQKSEAAAAKVPALRLQTDSTVHVLQVQSDKSRYSRKGFVRRVQPDPVNDLLPKLNDYQQQQQDVQPVVV